MKAVLSRNSFLCVLIMNKSLTTPRGGNMNVALGWAITLVNLVSSCGRPLVHEKTLTAEQLTLAWRLRERINSWLCPKIKHLPTVPAPSDYSYSQYFRLCLYCGVAKHYLAYTIQVTFQESNSFTHFILSSISNIFNMCLGENVLNIFFVQISRDKSIPIWERTRIKEIPSAKNVLSKNLQNLFRF